MIKYAQIPRDRMNVRVMKDMRHKMIVGVV